MQSSSQRFFFCHSCHKTLKINSTELVCPNCGSDFLQEAKAPSINNDPDLFISNLRSLFSFRLPRPGNLRSPQENSRNQAENNLNERLTSLLANFHSQRNLVEEEFKVQKQVVSEDDPENDCKICTLNFLIGEERSVLSCSHLYHTKCLEPWLRIKKCCPFCRQSL